MMFLLVHCVYMYGGACFWTQTQMCLAALCATANETLVGMVVVPEPGHCLHHPHTA